MDSAGKKNSIVNTLVHLTGLWGYVWRKMKGTTALPHPATEGPILYTGRSAESGIICSVTQSVFVQGGRLCLDKVVDSFIVGWHMGRSLTTRHVSTARSLEAPLPCLILSSCTFQRAEVTLRPHQVVHQSIEASGQLFSRRRGEWLLPSLS